VLARTGLRHLGSVFDHLWADQDLRSQVSASRMVSVAVQPVAAISIQVTQHSWNAPTVSAIKRCYSIHMINIGIVAALPDVRYRQRVQKRLTRLRKRLLAFVIKANPECFDHGGRLAPGCFPARVPPEAANLHGLMRRAECKLAMMRSHAECQHCS
jgi:hypothetical protein